MQIRAVTFDLDGTLLDTIGELAAACDAMLLELGRPALGLATVSGFVGKGMAVLVERCLVATDGEAPTPELLAAACAAFVRLYAAINGNSVREYPGVRAGLSALREQGLPLAVVTNKPAAFTAPLLAKSGLAEFFSVVVAGDTTAERKPHPLPLLHACAELGVLPGENVHVGDSANDVLAARAAGCLAFAVPYGYAGEAPLDAGKCHALVSGLPEAAARIAALNGAPAAPRPIG